MTEERVAAVKQMALNSDRSFRDAREVFIREVKNRGLKTGLEIGVEFGGHCLGLFSDGDVEKMWGIDPYQAGVRYALNSEQDEYEFIYGFVLGRLYRHNYTHVRKFSSEAIGDVPGKLDFVFIDADHQYTGVREDLEFWYPKVRDGGLVGGHDYGHKHHRGVKTAVDEFFGRLGAKVTLSQDGIWWVEKDPNYKRGGEIAVVIPTFNSSGFILSAIDIPLKDPRVTEIIISDDHSDDYDELYKILEGKPKIKLFRNNKRLGGFWNKFAAMEKCTLPFAILLDSDNSFDKGYIDRLFRIPVWRSDVIYAPDYAGEKLNYREFTGTYFYKENVGKMMDNPLTTYILNTGNFFVPVKSFLKCIWEGGQKVVGHVPCSAAINCVWLNAGNKVFVVDGLEYDHRFRKKGYWTERAKTMGPIIEGMKKAFIENTKFRFEDYGA